MFDVLFVILLVLYYFLGNVVIDKKETMRRAIQLCSAPPLPLRREVARLHALKTALCGMHISQCVNSIEKIDVTV